MYEQCGCGSAIRSHRYARVLTWRHSHRHPEETTGGESDTERADVDEEGMVARVGFSPNA